MNRFATSSEPGGLGRPATGVSDRAPDAPTRPPLRRAYESFTWMMKGISGLDAYERYVRHACAHHPHARPLTEAEFWRSRWDNESRNPKARCC